MSTFNDFKHVLALGSRFLPRLTAGPAEREWPLMRWVIALAVAVLMSMTGGCASMQPSIALSELDSFVAKPEGERPLKQVKVRWEVRDDVAQVCSQKLNSLGTQKVQAAPIACAIWNTPRQECVIVTARQVNHVTLGHEMRHCFEGHFH